MRRIYCICLFVVLSGFINAALPQEILKKEKIYTLNKNEVVAYEENSLGLHQGETGYIVVTADIKDFSRSYHIKGETYGPFDRRIVEPPVFNLETWGFIDSKKETSYVYFNGKEIGVHKNPLYPVGLKVARDSWSYVLIDQLEGTTKVVINGKEYGPFLNLKNYHLNHDGSRWAIVYYNEPEEYYVLFNNGKQVGPYKEIINFRFLEGRGNRWVMTAELPGVLPKQISGKEVKLFSVITQNGEVGTFEEELLSKSQYDFTDLISIGENYGQTVIQDQQIFFVANDDIYGPYGAIPTAIDMGEEYNKFNYIDPATNTLHFKGDGIFSRNVEDYYVSDSRRSVAVIKDASAGKDSLYLNDKYFQGIYDPIVFLKFAPKGEEWALLSDEKNGKFSLHFQDGRKFGPFKVNMGESKPNLLLGANAKNWAFFYQEAGNNEVRLLVNNQIREEEFIGEIALISEAGQEFFSWFSLEDRTLYLNKLLLE